MRATSDSRGVLTPCNVSQTLLRYALIASHFASVAKQYPQTRGSRDRSGRSRERSMALSQLPAHVVHKLGQQRVIQEFLSTSEYAKRAVLSGRLSFVHTFYPLFNVHSADFFSNNLFFQCPLVPRVGEKFQGSLPSFACLSMFRLPKPYCALRSQHLLSQMHFFVYSSRISCGAFP